MIYDMKYQDALDKAANLIALDQTTVYLDASEAPWDKATEVEAGGGVRLNGPTGVYVIARESGLTFKWPVNFEKPAANGKGYSIFDRDRLRDVAMKLPPEARKSFSDFLADEVLPGLKKCTDEWRGILNQQWDAEDCVRGLVEFSSQ